VSSDSYFSNDAYLRDGAEQMATVTLVESDRWYAVSRRLPFTLLQQTDRAASWSEASASGFRETSDRLQEVVAIWRSLFTRTIAPRALGGPLAIASFAGNEAAEQIPRLLLFLTYFSVSLASYYSLPIPATDGWHLALLALEGVRRKPLGRRFELTLTLLGWLGSGLLLCAMGIPCPTQLLRLLGLVKSRHEKIGKPWTGS